MPLISHSGAGVTMEMLNDFPKIQCPFIRQIFPWFYTGIEIFGYDKRGRDEIEEQEKFD